MQTQEALPICPVRWETGSNGVLIEYLLLTGIVLDESVCIDDDSFLAQQKTSPKNSIFTTPRTHQIGPADRDEFRGSSPPHGPTRS